MAFGVAERRRFDAPPAGWRWSSWIGQWTLLTAASALLATLFDAALLQRRRTFFTGGFLSTDHVTNAVQAAGFVLGSLLADAAVIGLVAAFVLIAAARLRVPRSLTLTAAVVLSLGPIVVADFLAYQLLTFVGDAFDFGLMFELAGRSPAEILAVSGAHLVWVVAIAAALLTVVAGLGVFLARALRVSARDGAPLPVTRVLALACVLLMAGIVGTTTLRAASDVIDNGLRRKPTGRLLGGIFHAVSDLDRDGFSAFSRPPDPDALEARISPWAVDVPGNGIDENGVGGDLPVSFAPYSEPPSMAPQWRSRPNVVLIVLESFRADVVGTHAAGVPVTPVLDQLASAGAISMRAYSHNGYTVQSRRHIFAGSVADLRSGSLVDDFKANGYETAYFSGQDESFGGSAAAVGFERADVAYDARKDVDRRYSTFSTAGSLAVPHNVLVDRIEQFLRGRDKARPLFLYVNFHDTHFPYHHGEVDRILPAPVLRPFDIRPGRAEELRAMYLNTAANVDRAIGRVLAAARASLGSDPGVIVLSDHGESLFDEGFLGHGYALNDAQTRIPLIVANLPMHVREPFGQADLRDALWEALTVPDAGRPRVTADPSRALFQYLGSVRRPVQIAFTTIADRIVYDFRARRVQVGADEWRRPEDFSPTQAARFLALIHTWEAMVVARTRELGDD